MTLGKETGGAVAWLEGRCNLICATVEGADTSMPV